MKRLQNMAVAASLAVLPAVAGAAPESQTSKTSASVNSLVDACTDPERKALMPADMCEVSTDGGKTWIVVLLGGAVGLAGLAKLGPVLIRRREEISDTTQGSTDPIETGIRETAGINPQLESETVFLQKLNALDYDELSPVEPLSETTGVSHDADIQPAPQKHSSSVRPVSPRSKERNPEEDLYDHIERPIMQPPPPPTPDEREAWVRIVDNFSGLSKLLPIGDQRSANPIKWILAGTGIVKLTMWNPALEAITPTGFSSVRYERHVDYNPTLLNRWLTRHLFNIGIALRLGAGNKGILPEKYRFVPPNKLDAQGPISTATEESYPLAQYPVGTILSIKIGGQYLKLLVLADPRGQKYVQLRRIERVKGGFVFQDNMGNTKTISPTDPKVHLKGITTKTLAGESFIFVKYAEVARDEEAKTRTLVPETYFLLVKTPSPGVPGGAEYTKTPIRIVDVSIPKEPSPVTTSPELV